MSLSKEHRLKALADALTLMIERLGDKALDTEIFYMNEDPFSRVPKTTWRELEEYGFTERCDSIGHPQCQFTGGGWYNAVIMTERIASPKFKERLSKLTAAMKDQVKGRHEDAYLYTDQLASAAGVSEDFVINAIESRLIDHHFKIQRGGVGTPMEGDPNTAEVWLRPLDGD